MAQEPKTKNSDAPERYVSTVACMAPVELTLFTIYDA